jgi:N-methylhydantoinase B
VMMQVVPERAMACPTNLVNITVAGRDERGGVDGGEYVWYVWLAGGWGGRPGTRDAHTHLIPLGPGTNLQPVETLERIFPMRFDAFELRPDSEGAGRHRGGFALHCPWRVTSGSASLNAQGDRQRIPGWGAEGGHSPEGTDLIYDPQGAAVRFDVMSAGNKIEPNVQIDFYQSGGGGWQDPLTREPSWVLDDVIAGLVSVERAREAYGVVIVPADDLLDATVDEAETAAVRAARA